MNKLPVTQNIDINTLAHAILERATSDQQPRPKNPAAVALGKLGGLKGGPARTKALSAAKRKELARHAALARWHKPLVK